MTRVEPVRRQEHDVTVRFSHVDAAGIVFYPRYLEMLAALPVELPLASPPFSFTLEFHQPNRLGDRLTLVCERDGAGGAWRIRGRMDSRVHFTAALRDGNEEAPVGDEHRPALPAYRTPGGRIGGWAVDATGRLQLSRYYELVNAAVEQWFEQTLDLPFRRLHANHHGIPTVRLTTRCRELPRTGSDVRMWIRPTRVGKRSVGFTSWLVSGGRCALATEQIIVMVDNGGPQMRSLPWPSEMRAELEAQLAAAGGTEAPGHEA